MGRHQMATSSGRARVALGALPLVATVGAIGIGSAVMSPVSSDAPLEPPAGAGSPGGGFAAAPPASLPLGPAVAPAPVQVLDLASTDGAVTANQSTPGGTIGSVRPGGGGDGDAAPVRRAARASADGDGPARDTTARAAGTPSGGGGGSGGGGASGGGGDDGGAGGSDDSGNGDSGGSGSGGASGSGGSGSGSESNGGLLGGVGGAVGGVVGGLGNTVSGTTSMLSFGESSGPVLSFD